MPLTYGINGFGRMGRLVLRALDEQPDLHCVAINDPAGTPASMAHLLNHDSVQGRWHHLAHATPESLQINGRNIRTSANEALEATDWSGCDFVVEASGAFRTSALLQPYLDRGVRQVVVTAPVKDPEALNVVVGVNHHEIDTSKQRILTAASCTTNCLAPLVKVLLESVGIERGSMTTIHSFTNTQRIIDAHHKDLRRARASSMNLIPTSTGSATAITRLFPQLAGKLDGHAVRVPLATGSLTDCVFEVSTPTSTAQINALMKAASEGELAGILGYEEQPLVSGDFLRDPRSAIVDALSTLVVDRTQVKVYAWYDNEWGYANRTAELLRMVAGLTATP